MSKPAGKQKLKPPPYPRPVPHFVVEELPPRAEDIAWNALHGGNDYSDNNENAHDEVELQIRAAKRRRIEACATLCLRGDPLYIISAQLKGPFKNGWKNPWTKKSKQGVVRKDTEDRHLEIPETAKKMPSNVDEEKTKVATFTLPSSRPLHTNVRQSPLQKSMAPGLAPSPFTSKLKAQSDELSPKVPRQTKERRVEEWLRINDEFAKKSEALIHSSPTPSNRQRRTPKLSQELGSAPQASQSEPLKRPSAKISSLRTTTSLQPINAHKLSEAERRVQKLSRDMQNIITEPPAHDSRILLEEVKRSTHPTDGFSGSSKICFASSKLKRSGLQTAPADAHMSPFEFRKVPARDEEQYSQKAVHMQLNKTEGQDAYVVDNIRKKGDAKIDARGLEHGAQAVVAKPSKDGGQYFEEDVFATAPQAEAQGHRNDGKLDVIVEEQGVVEPEEEPLIASTSRPVISTAVSGISTSDFLPSAQPRPEPVHSISSATHDEKLLSIKPIMSVSERTEEQNGTGGEPRHAEKGEAASNLSNASEDVIADDAVHKCTNDEVEVVTPAPDYTAVELNTQELLANIEPFNLSTVKKPKQATKQETPITATKTRLDKKRKKTSFAMDSSPMPSHGSIMDVMKAKVSKKLGNSTVFMFGKDDLDIEVSDDESESQRKRSRPLSGAGKPKSILKSANPASSPSSIRRSKSGISTRQEQDGQLGIQRPIASGQNVIDEVNFDLDAAIDDLGSFLGTWDAEKEASSLDIEL